MAAEGLRQRRRQGTTVPYLDAIQRASRARDLIPAEQAKIRDLIDKETDPVRRDHYRWQHDLVEWQLTAAAVAAKKRLDYYLKLRTDEDWDREFVKCADGPTGTMHWFDQWAWTLDPRSDTGLQVLPFVLFPVQRKCVEWLESLVFDRRQMGCVEKSRDMGATWIAVGFSVKHWLFREYFQAMFVSYTEDEVDHKKNEGTIFGKLRFLVKYLPPQMKPKKFVERDDATFLNLRNPDNGSLITGKAPTANVSRSERQTVIFADEFAAFPFGGHPQHTAMSQTTRSLIPISTANGSNNKFVQLVETPGMPVFRLYWRDHPWKDDRWRQGEPIVRGMKPHQVAQEIEIDHKATETGQRLKEFNEIVHCITISELAAFYGEIAYETFEDASGLKTTVPRIPPVGKILVGMDWGETPDHPTAVVYIWRPPENMELHECLFIIGSIVRPEWPERPSNFDQPTPRRIANAMFELETSRRWGKQMFSKRLMSPERLDVRKAFRGDPKAKDPLPPHLRFTFNPWKARNDYGYAQFQAALQIDWDRMHPFRRYPMDYGEDGSELAKMRATPIPGFTRLYLVCADGQAELYARKTTDLKVTPGTNDSGHARGRAEIPMKKRDRSLSGEERDTDRKIFDDFIDAVRGALSEDGPTAVPLSDEERLLRQFDAEVPHLTTEAIAGMDDQAKVMAILTRQEQMERMLVKVRSGSRAQEYDPANTGLNKQL